MHVKRHAGRFVVVLISLTALLSGCSGTTSNTRNASSAGSGGSPTGAGRMLPDSPVPQISSPGMRTSTSGSVPGTATATTQATGLYAAEIKAAAKDADSQFERDVLKDGVITRAEYLEAINRYKSCLEGHGITVKLEDHNGYYQIVTISQKELTKEDDANELACSKGTVMHISGLYKKTITDPEDRGYDSVIYACLKRLGLTPPGYTEQDYVSDIKASMFTTTYQNGTALNTPTPIKPDLPFDATDPRFGACLNNPQNPLMPASEAGSIRPTQ